MPELVNLRIDGRPVTVPAGTSVAAAVLISGQTRFRTSVTGEPRAPLCGMGTCFECRLTIDGRPHSRACQTECREGMNVTST